MAALSLEASGFAARGEGWRLAADNQIGLPGPLPISTFGGLKSRGNPLGATGVYQAVEIALQLRGESGDNQVHNAQIGMTKISVDLAQLLSHICSENSRCDLSFLINLTITIESDTVCVQNANVKAALSSAFGSPQVLL